MSENIPEPTPEFLNSLKSHKIFRWANEDREEFILNLDKRIEKAKAEIIEALQRKDEYRMQLHLLMVDELETKKAVSLSKYDLAMAQASAAAEAAQVNVALAKEAVTKGRDWLTDSERKRLTEGLIRASSTNPHEEAMVKRLRFEQADEEGT